MGNRWEGRRRENKKLSGRTITIAGLRQSNFNELIQSDETQLIY